MWIIPLWQCTTVETIIQYREKMLTKQTYLRSRLENRIYNGQFVVYTYKNQEGENGNGQEWQRYSKP